MWPIIWPHVLVLYSSGQVNLVLRCFGVVNRCKQNLILKIVGTDTTTRSFLHNGSASLLNLPPIEIAVKSSAAKSAAKFATLGEISTRAFGHSSISSWIKNKTLYLGEKVSNHTRRGWLRSMPLSSGRRLARSWILGDPSNFRKTVVSSRRKSLRSENGFRSVEEVDAVAGGKRLHIYWVAGHKEIP